MPAVQKYVSSKAADYLETKIGTAVDIGGLYLDFPNGVSIEKLYLENQQSDTLLYTEEFDVSIDYFALFHGEIEISEVNLSNSFSNIEVNEDSTFSFDYILQAFANDSGQVEEVDTAASSSTSIDIGFVNLNNVRFNYKSAPDGLNMALDIGSLLVDVEEFNLEDQVFLAKEIQLKNTSANVDILKLVENDNSVESATNMIVGSELLVLDHVNFSFNDLPTELHFKTNIGLLEVSAEPISLNDQIVNLNSIKLKNSIVDFKTKSIIKQEDSDRPEMKGKPWKVSLAELLTDSLIFIYDDNAFQHTPKQVDFSHLKVNLQKLAATDIYFNGADDLAGSISALNASEKSGFKMTNTSVGFKITEKSITVMPFQLATNNSYINVPTELNFNDLASLSENINNLAVNLDFNASKIGMADLKFFAPEVLDSLPFKGLANQVFTINGNIKGKVDDIIFNQLSIKNQRSTSFKLNGKVNGLPEVDQLGFNLNRINLNTTAKDLRFILGAEYIPQSINLPKSINLMASANGGANSLTTQINLKTTLGNLTAKGSAKNITDTLNATYNFMVDMPYFKVGELINDSTIGGLGFAGNIKGKGLTAKDINLSLDAKVKDIEYLSYQYEDLEINGNYNHETFKGDLAMNDSNLIFTFKGVARFDSLLPKFDFAFNLGGVDLQHLGFTEEDLRIRGRFDVNIEGSNLDNLNGGLDIRDVLIIKNENQYPIDSLLFLSVIDTSKTDISVKSNLFDASLQGKIKLSELGSTFQNHFNQYLGFSNTDSNAASQNFKFEVKLYDPDLLTEVILPDLGHFETGDINGEFDSKTSKFDFNLYFSSIQYANVLVDSLSFISNSTAERMEANLLIKKIGYDTLALENISFTNTLANDSLVSFLSLQEDSMSCQFQLAGSLTKFEEDYKFKFLEDEQIIDFENWKVDPKNEIFIGNTTTFNNLIFSNKKQKISLQSEGDYLNFSAKDFELENIFNLIQRSNQLTTDFSLILKEATDQAKLQSDSLGKDSTTAFLTGIFNADAKIPQTEDGLLSGTTEITQIEVNGISIGNLFVEANSTKINTNLKANLKGNGNSLAVSGYLTDNGFDFTFDIEKFKLKTIEAFSNKQLKRSSGYLAGTGNFASQGETTTVDGALNFKDIKFRSTYLGEEYHFLDERITFNKNQLQFERFTVLDSADRPFKISGNLFIDDLTNPRFDLKVNSKNFQFLNTNKNSDNDLFYGTVFITSDITVKGTAEKPIINANVKLNEGTDITFVVPNSEAATVNSDGIVKFVDRNNNLPALLTEEKNNDTIRTDFRGVDLTAFLEIDDKTKMTMVVDPVTGDRLLIRGGGKIKTNVDIAGNISMNGVYEIKEGNYELRLYNLVRRKFELVPGSKLIWNGDPLKAKMDINGSYIAKAAPINLLGSQVSNLNQAEISQYNKKLPFEVILMIGGELMKPEISFKLDLPNEEKGALGGSVLAKLTEINNDDSELNKQVFALIVLKRFIAQDPFASGGSGSNTARQSVSQLLNQQLNNLTDKYIKGVEIELNVDSYENFNANGEAQGQTDLNVALSKEFLDDRVKVRLNGDFGVENQSNNTGGIAGDISVEYKITEDGTYRIKLYRDNKFAGFIEGQLIETGVSLIFNKEYELFKNLFKKPDNVEVEDE